MHVRGNRGLVMVWRKHVTAR